MAMRMCKTVDLASIGAPGNMPRTLFEARHHTAGFCLDSMLAVQKQRHQVGIDFLLGQKRVRRMAGMKK